MSSSTDDPTPESPSPTDGGTADAEARDEAREEEPRPEGLYFFPERDVSDEELRRILAEGPEHERAWAISCMMRYAQWEDIWTYVNRDEVREIFPALDLPDNLRAAWARMLKIETPVG